MPRRQHFPSWQAARVSSYEVLQPVEPQWHDQMHTKPSFLAMVEKAKADFKQKRAVRCLIVNTSTQKVMGGVNLSRLEWGAKRAGALSYWLQTSYQNQGYMREALGVLLGYAFTNLKLHRIEAEVLATNRASLKLLKHFGFQHEGTNRQSIRITGVWKDHERYALINAF